MKANMKTIIRAIEMMIAPDTLEELGLTPIEIETDAEEDAAQILEEVYYALEDEGQEFLDALIAIALGLSAQGQEKPPSAPSALGGEAPQP